MGSIEVCEVRTTVQVLYEYNEYEYCKYVNMKRGPLSLFPGLTAGREEHEGGGLERVLGGQQDPPMVHPPVELGVLGAEDGEVPLEDVVLHGLGVVRVRRRARVRTHLLHLLHDALDGWVLHVELGRGGRGGGAGARHLLLLVVVSCCVCV